MLKNKDYDFPHKDILPAVKHYDNPFALHKGQGVSAL